MPASIPRCPLADSQEELVSRLDFMRFPQRESLWQAIRVHRAACLKLLETKVGEMLEEPAIKRSELKRRLGRWVQHVEESGASAKTEPRDEEPAFELSDKEANMLVEALWWLLAEKGSERNAPGLDDRQLWGDYEALLLRLQNRLGKRRFDGPEDHVKVVKGRLVGRKA